MITPEIRSFLDRHRLAYVATVSPDNMPNVSPKGTISYWDENTIMFAEIRSPDTIRNIESNPHTEISTIDPLSRKGYLFRGRCKILRDGAIFDNAISQYRKRGVKSPIRAIIMVDIYETSKVTSPLYDMGISEEEIISKSKRNLGL